MSSIEIEIVGVKVTISQTTLDAFEEHAAFCSPGQAWLIRNDPESYKEQELIESVKDSLEADFDVAISGLTEEERYELSDEFMELEDQEWWEYLSDGIEAMKPPKKKNPGKKRP